MFCAGRVPDEDLRRTMKACGGSILTTVADLGDSVLGTCQHFEERQIGGERSESNEIWAIVFFAFQRYSSKFVSDYASVDEESDFSYKKSLFIKKIRASNKVDILKMARFHHLKFHFSRPIIDHWNYLKFVRTYSLIPLICSTHTQTDRKLAWPLDIEVDDSITWCGITGNAYFLEPYVQTNIEFSIQVPLTFVLNGMMANWRRVFGDLSTGSTSSPGARKPKRAPSSFAAVPNSSWRRRSDRCTTPLWSCVVPWRMTPSSLVSALFYLYSVIEKKQYFFHIDLSKWNSVTLLW